MMLSSEIYNFVLVCHDNVIIAPRDVTSHTVILESRANRASIVDGFCQGDAQVIPHHKSLAINFMQASRVTPNYPIDSIQAQLRTRLPPYLACNSTRLIVLYGHVGRWKVDAQSRLLLRNNRINAPYLSRNSNRSRIQPPFHQWPFVRVGSSRAMPTFVPTAQPSRRAVGQSTDTRLDTRIIPEMETANCC
jgi:hypothetical protein